MYQIIISFEFFSFFYDISELGSIFGVNKGINCIIYGIVFELCFVNLVLYFVYFYMFGKFGSLFYVVKIVQKDIDSLYI